MATVTGMTAAAMQAIRNGTVVSAHFDSANHLILTKYDGTTVDAGVLATSTTTQAGIVELATNAETQTGTATNLAVTPAGIASLPGYRVQIVTGIAETAAPAAWPYGVSMQSVGSGSGWSLNNGFGTVITSSISSGYTVQEFYKSAGGTSTVQSWERTYNAFDGGGGWTAWRERSVVTNLAAGSFTQATALASYPEGWSRLYYTNTGTGWDFSGNYGEVMTYRNGTDFAEQVYTQHSNGTGTPSRWFRTANATGGWTGWQKFITDPGSYTTWTPTWSTTSGIHLPSFGNATASFKAHKLGKNVHVTFDVTFGSTTNFGASATTTDNWTFSLPAAWPANASAPGTFLGVGDMYKDATNLGFTRIKLSGTTAISFGILTCFVAGALGGGIGGDVDSVTPWTWASGHAIRGSFDYETTA
jgi:hypothetical protein